MLAVDSVGEVTRFDTVSFLTDYGTTDEFVGVVKSVICDIAPHVGVIDLTHGIRPFDVRAGSLALARSIGYVPAGVVLAVVDPGVGTDRRAIAIEVADGAGVLIGPDNGLLAPAAAMAGGAERAFELTNADYQIEAAGATFDGRDVFGPAAAEPAPVIVRSESIRSSPSPSEMVPGMLVMSTASGPARALASSIAARSVQAPAPSAHSPSPGVASKSSARLSTVKVTAWVGPAATVERTKAAATQVAPIALSRDPRSSTSGFIETSRAQSSPSRLLASRGSPA